MPNHNELVKDLDLLILLVSSIRDKYQERLLWSRRLQLLLRLPKTVHNKVLLEKHLEKKAI